MCIRDRAFISVAFISAALVTVVIRASSPDRLSRLIIEQQQETLKQLLVNYYVARGSWEGIEQAWWRLEARMIPTPAAQATGSDQPSPVGPEERLGFDRDRRNLFGLADASGKVLISADPVTPPGTYIALDRLQREGVVLSVNGSPIGYLLRAARTPAFNPAETLFLRRTYQALALALGGALVVAVVIGLWLARRLTRPLLALTEAAQKIAQGNLEQEVAIASRDEIGQLAQAFNVMSREVARANQIRRQMTADIAHDLRTPLTVIAGYIESMRDGILAPTVERFAMIYAEIERLQKMVEDLRILSQADAGELRLNCQAVQPEAILERAASVFQHRAAQKGIRLQVSRDGNLPLVWLDEDRIMQVMDNLLSNALRHTPAGGEVILEAKPSAGGVEFIVRDTGEGIPPDEIPKIFERFYRADKSRHTETGESGLGLAIVKAIVEAHKGRVWAVSIPGGGTAIHFEMPSAL
ncbi:MAG: ATP-binding protein, partial [Thermanaerothrix sp.]|nr:ATP-binding protein [Thermanaerothrix sp.]